MKRVIGEHSSLVPAGGPYSPSVRIGQLVAVSGQCGYLPGRVLASGIREQTKLALQNMQIALQASGCGTDDVLSVNVYLTDRSDFAVMNEIYESFFTEPRPARTTVYVGLAKDVLFEVDCLAVAP